MKIFQKVWNSPQTRRSIQCERRIALDRFFSLSGNRIPVIPPRPVDIAPADTPPIAGVLFFQGSPRPVSHAVHLSSARLPLTQIPARSGVVPEDSKKFQIDGTPGLRKRSDLMQATRLPAFLPERQSNPVPPNDRNIGPTVLPLLSGFFMSPTLSIRRC